jgi:hypothetical protein
MKDRAREAVRRLVDGGGGAANGGHGGGDDDDGATTEEKTTANALVSEMVLRGRATVPPEARGMLADRLRAVLGERSASFVGASSEDMGGVAMVP